MTSRPVPRLRVLSFLGLLACALLSWFKGQDTNWDLLNYHRYIAFAFFHDRLGVDLAAAGMQSYFNPSLDIPIYWLNEHLDGWLVGLIVGAWHGLVFVLTLLIVHELWPVTNAKRLGALLTTVAGVLAPAFWGGLGNSMGDNAAAVPALAALWCAVRFVRLQAADVPPGQGGHWLLACGLLLGLCTALKLTNATLAVALGLSLLMTVRTLSGVAKVVAWILPAGLLGVLLGGGWWFYEVWQEFGNPFFPQFGKLFPSALADSVSIVDQRFIPGSVGAFLLRPLLMPFKYEITSEFFVLPLLWPVWYLAGVFFLYRWGRERFGGEVATALSWRPEQRLVLNFVLIAVALWELLFGIYRYTAALEPLLPLCVVLLLWRSGSLLRWQVWLRRLFILSMAIAVLGGAVNWGHADWAARSFRPATSMQVDGSRPFVLVVGTGNSWILPFLRHDASFASVGGSFQFGKNFDAEIRRRARAADRVYALVGMSQNWRFDVVDKANAWLGALGVLRHPSTCDGLARLVQRTRPHAGFARCEQGAACEEHVCQLTKLQEDQAEVDRRDQASVNAATDLLKTYGLSVDSTRCSVEGAFLGRKRYPFRLCELRPASGP